MRVPRPFRIGLVAAGAVALSAGVVAITASASGIPSLPLAAGSPSPSGSPKANAKADPYCDVFLRNLASDLGKSQSDVQAAMQKAASQTVDQAVKDGKLTAAQAQKIKDRLAQSNGNACAGLGPAIGEHGGFGPGGPGGFKGLPQDVLLNALATTLNMPPADVAAAIKSGKSIHDLAGANTTESDFKSRLAPNLKTALDQAVKDGKLTQSQADAIYSGFQSAPHVPGWDRPNRADMHNNRPKPAPSATP